MSRTDGFQKHWLEGVSLEALSDEAYFLRCRGVGWRIRHWDDCYIGLIVGAVDRGLPQRNGFRDIYHMAGVQARMSRKRVTEVLAIARAIRCCPALFRMFTRAEVAWTKVRAVARLATPERDAELSKMVQRMTRGDLVNWIREQMPSRPRPAVRHVGAARDGAPIAASPAGEPAAGGTTSASALETSKAVGCTSTLEVPPDPPEARPECEDPLTPLTTEPKVPGELASAMQRSAHLGSRSLEALLVDAGVDPLILEKLRIDREALSTREGRRLSLVDALEEAIRAFQPAKRAVKMPYLSVIAMCPECRCRTVRTPFGPLPVDELDAHLLRPSGETVDLDQASASRKRDQRAASPEPGVAARIREVGAGAPSTAVQEPRRPPARLQRLVLARQGGRCAMRGCLEVPSQCHHLAPFAWHHRHSEDELFWLCRRHHDLVHAGGIANPGDTPDRWRPTSGRSQNGPIDGRREAVDEQARRFRQGPERRDGLLAKDLAPEDSIGP